MKSSLENLLSDQLQGLLLPPEEGGNSWAILWVVGLFIVVLSFIIGRWKRLRNSRVAVAKRELDRLEKDTGIEQQAIQLASILRRGLNVSRLDEYKPQNLSEWKTFHTQLDVACYSNNDKNSGQNNKQIQALLTQAKVWLKE